MFAGEGAPREYNRTGSDTSGEPHPLCSPRGNGAVAESAAGPNDALSVTVPDMHIYSVLVLE